MDGFRDLPSNYELLVPEPEHVSVDYLKNYFAISDVVVSVFGRKFNSNLLDKAPKLRLIANYGVGYDNIDVDYATSLGIVVTNTPDPVTEPTAELAMGLMLALARKIVFFHNGILRDRLPPWTLMNNLSSTLIGKTLGIIGMGAIGKAFARRAHASGMDILYHNRNRVESSVEKQFNAQYTDLKYLLQHSDYVSLNVPLTTETYQMIGKEEFKLMKSTAFLINTSRGNVINEAELIKALKDKIIAGAGLDVYSDEPNIPVRLKRLDNVVLTPHSGTGTFEARAETSRYVAEIILRFFNNNLDIPVVNPAVFDTEAYKQRSV